MDQFSESSRTDELFWRKSVGGGCSLWANALCNTFIIFIETYIVRVMRYSIQNRKQASTGRPTYELLYSMTQVSDSYIGQPPIFNDHPVFKFTHAYYYVYALFLCTFKLLSVDRMWTLVRMNTSLLTFVHFQRQWRNQKLLHIS